MSLTFPFRFLSHAAGEEGGGLCPSPSPWPPSAPTREEEGGTWGAGKNERWKPEFDPILSERWETWG